MITNEIELYDFLEELPDECYSDLSQSGSVDYYADFWVDELNMKACDRFARDYVSSYGIDVSYMDNHTLCMYILFVNAEYKEVANG